LLDKAKNFKNISEKKNYIKKILNKSLDINKIMACEEIDEYSVYLSPANKETSFLLLKHGAVKNYEIKYLI
jgi:hypothetical protein